MHCRLNLSNTFTRAGFAVIHLVSQSCKPKFGIWKSGCICFNSLCFNGLKEKRREKEMVRVRREKKDVKKKSGEKREDGAGIKGRKERNGVVKGQETGYCQDD